MECRECGRSFWERFPGRSAAQTGHRTVPPQCLPEALGWHQPQPPGPSGRASAAPPSSAGSRISSGAAQAERSGAVCPQVLGIDEHFFTRRQGYATTFCDLRRPSDLRCGAGALRSRPGELSGQAGRQRAGARRLHGFGQRLSRHRAQTLSPTPVSWPIASMSSASSTTTSWPAGAKSTRSGAKNRGLLSLMRRHRHNLKPEQVTTLAGLLRAVPRPWRDLPLQTAALLPAAEKAPHPQAVRAT